VGDSSPKMNKERAAVIERGLKAQRKLLVGWLTKKFGDRELAHDIAQDACLNVWRYAQDHSVVDVKAFLFKTAANLAANEFRRRARRRASGFDDGPMEVWTEVVASDAPSAERTLEARQVAQQYLAVIRDLPEKHRRAFAMSRFEGQSYAEIANHLGVSVSSVEKYMMTVLKALRSHDNQGHDDQKVIPFTGKKVARSRC